MALMLVDQPEGGKATVNGSKATVTVEAPTTLEVGSTEAKNLAKSAVIGLIGKCGISSQSGSYPVDAEGKQITDLTKPLPEGFRYRQDFTFQEGM